jgi:hypothetical protein
MESFKTRWIFNFPMIYLTVGWIENIDDDGWLLENHWLELMELLDLVRENCEFWLAEV